MASEWLVEARRIDESIHGELLIGPLLEKIGLEMLNIVLRDELGIEKVKDLWALGDMSTDVEKILLDYGAAESDVYKISLAFFHTRDFEMAKQKALENDNLSMPRGTHGGIYDQEFIEIVAPLYDLHMGVENMAPLLYSLVRFIKPKNILEIGAGYTSMFLVQALADNFREMTTYIDLQKKGICKVNADTRWCLDSLSTEPGILHCVDNMAHEFSTADKVVSVARKLGIEKHLNHINQDAWNLKLENVDKIDFMWVDFGAGQRLDTFLQIFWDKLSDGGYIIVHSTLTNEFTRKWVEKMRNLSKSNDAAAPWSGKFETLSFLEPHKIFQNSCSLFQKRENYQEPIHTKYP